MAMSATEQKVLGDTIDALGAITLVVGAALNVLTAEVPDFKHKMLATITLAQASHAQNLAGTSDAPKLLAMATQFVSLLQDSKTLQ